MTDTSMVSMNVNKEVVEAIIAKNIKTSLLAAMGNDEQKSAVLDAIVMESMNLKVNSEGKISNYQNDNIFSYLDWRVQTMIRSATRDALDEFVATQQNAIKKEIKKAIIANASSIANQLVSSFAESSADGWRYKVNLQVVTKLDD